jgi:hypothetical protein
MMELTPEALRDSVRRLEDLEDAYREAVEETEGEIAEALEIVERQLAEFSSDAIEALCWYAREADLTVAAVDAEKKRLAEVAARASARKEWAKDRIRDLFERRGIRKAKAGTWSLHLQKGSQSVVETEEIEPSLLPKRFRRDKVEVNKAEIKKALKAKEEVEGFALKRGPETVVIR